MCRELVSCADFKAILTPFSGVIMALKSAQETNSRHI